MAYATITLPENIHRKSVVDNNIREMLQCTYRTLTTKESNRLFGFACSNQKEDKLMNQTKATKAKGNPFKRGSSWTYIIYIPDSKTGKLKQKWVGGFSNKKEAQYALAKAKVELAKGTYINDSHLTVEKYLNSWFETYKKTIEPSTAAGYGVNIKNHIIPHIGRIKLSALDRVTITDFYFELEKEGLSPTSIKYVNSTLRKALNDAVADGLIAKNPCKNAKKPKITKYNAPILNDIQTKQLLRGAKGTLCESEVMLAVITGLRRGEILGLRFQDFDFEKNTVHVRQQVSKVQNTEGTGTTWGVKPLKTEGSIRTIYLPPIIMDVVKARKRVVAEQSLKYGSSYHNGDLVFCNENGAFKSPQTLYHQFKKLLKELNLPIIRFHDLRHTCATTLLESDVPLKVISELLGHSSIAITSDIYCEVIKKKRQPADVMQNLFLNEVT